MKVDDAEVEQYPWNQRILLVFPSGTVKAIRVLKTFGLKVLFRRPVHSFVTYLTKEYGPQWRHDAARFDRIHRTRGSSSVSPIGKRKRRDEMVDPETHKVGGIRKSESEATNLLQDVKCGFRILRQVSSSTWWEWTGGSFGGGTVVTRSAWRGTGYRYRYPLLCQSSVVRRRHAWIPVREEWWQER